MRDSTLCVAWYRKNLQNNPSNKMGVRFLANSARTFCIDATPDYDYASHANERWTSKAFYTDGWNTANWLILKSLHIDLMTVWAHHSNSSLSDWVQWGFDWQVMKCNVCLCMHICCQYRYLKQFIKSTHRHQSVGMQSCTESLGAKIVVRYSYNNRWPSARLW